MVPVLGLLVWAEVNGVRVASMWETIYGFRTDAFDVITRGHMSAPLSRVRDLLLLFVGSGLGVLIVLFLVSSRRAFSVRPAVTAAVVAMLAVDVAGIVLGGSYWTPYLVALVPATVLCVALVLVSGSWERLMKASVVFAAVSSALLLTYFGFTHVTGRSESPHATYTGRAVGEVAQPDDTIVVLYGVPEIVRASGLDSPYPYLWSLPVRTLDPELTLLRATVQGDDAPEWIVQRERPECLGPGRPSSAARPPAQSVRRQRSRLREPGVAAGGCTASGSASRGLPPSLAVARRPMSTSAAIATASTVLWAYFWNAGSLAEQRRAS